MTTTVVIDGNNLWANVACRIWTGATNRGGYGRRFVDGRMQLVHRLAWIEDHGPIPPETPFVLHHCDTPACYEGQHLFLGTHQDNMDDMAAKGRSPWGQKTHCPQGHPYDVENTIIYASGSRACRVCRRDRVNAWKRASRRRS